MIRGRYQNAAEGTSPLPASGSAAVAVPGDAGDDAGKSLG